jgi:AAA15 family ATPase/GTPase
MLLSFRVANVLSIREEQVLSFVATDLNEGSARRTRVREASKTLSVVPVIGIYGANASGKTKVLDALIQMQTAVLNSVDWFRESAPVRRIPFLLDDISAAEPSFFEVDIELAGVRYTYGFEMDDDQVRGEWLHAYPRGKRQVWFDRDDEGEVAFPGDGLRGEKLELARRTRHDSLFLTVGALSFNHPQLVPVFEWFRDNLWLITPEWPDRNSRLLRGKQEVIHDSAFRDSVARLLAVADLGISGIEVVQGLDDEIRFRHRMGNADKPLEFEGESLGTRSWFTLATALLRALGQSTVVLVDELDASLHPIVCAEAVRMFENNSSNTRGAQMLFTTHDVTLLRTLTGGGRVLDRDSIWLTEKDSEGATKLYPLNSFHPAPRKDENLLRKYMLGSYGGRPNIAPGALAREVEESLS